MARTSTKTPNKKLDIATAEQADGALPTIRSVYDLVGVKDIKYREKTFAAYQSQLRRLDLVELQDHAYELAVVPASNKQIMIDRLEEKYLRENPEQRMALVASRQAAAARGEGESLEEQTERILSQGR